MYRSKGGFDGVFHVPFQFRPRLPEVSQTRHDKGRHFSIFHASYDQHCTYLLPCPKQLIQVDTMANVSNEKYSAPAPPYESQQQFQSPQSTGPQPIETINRGSVASPGPQMVMVPNVAPPQQVRCLQGEAGNAFAKTSNDSLQLRN